MYLHLLRYAKSFKHIFSPEKSILWTDAGVPGVDQNCQRDLGAIGPYEFQGKLVWTHGPICYVFREIRMDKWRKKFVKSSPLDWYRS